MQSTENYIPILVFLRNGLRVEYKQYSLENLLKKIVAPDKNNLGASYRNIMLILDSLDEYNNNAKEKLYDTLEALRDKYTNLKSIVTTRLEAELLAKITTHKLDVYDSYYITLLQFTEGQLNAFKIMM